MSPAKQDKLTAERCRELVLNAIDRIHVAQKEFRELQSNARSSIHARVSSKVRAEAMESEFAWQWRNVEVLLRGEEE